MMIQKKVKSEMTLEIKLTDQTMINYSGTDDAIRAFNVAVNNGQARLALQILTQVIDGLADKIESLDNSSNQEIVKPVDVTPVSVEPEKKQEVIVEEVKQAEPKISEPKNAEVKEEKLTKAKS